MSSQEDFLKMWLSGHKDGVGPIEIEEYYTVEVRKPFIPKAKEPIIIEEIITPEIKRVPLDKEDIIRIEKQLEQLKYNTRDIDYVEIIKRWNQGTYEVSNYTDRGYNGKYAAPVQPIDIIAITVDNGVIEIPKRNFK